MITGKNYIGNQRSAEGTITYKTFNPITNTQNDNIFTEATNSEINKAVNLASNAFTTYKNYTGKEKSIFLNTIAQEIINLDQLLIQTYCNETGLPEARAIGERARTIGQLQAFSKLVSEGSWVEASIDTQLANRQPIPKPDIRKLLIPIGPIVVFGASNFPLAYSTAGGDTASALAAGCPVIVKSHPMHAGTGELIASAIIKAIQKTGMPEGVFSNINSSGIEVGQQLVQHPKIKAVGFTGSINGGRALYDLAAKRKEPIPVFAEMGSINPVILLPMALEKRSEELAKTYANSITLGAGQFCTNPGLLLAIKNKALDNFINNLASEILKISPTTMLHPAIKNAYETKKELAINQNGTKIVAAYEKNCNPNDAKQTILTVEGDTFIQNPTLHHEIFGPYSIIVQCKDSLQLEKIISELEGQLTGTIIAEDDELTNYTSIINALTNRVGRIIYNGVPTGVEVCPSMVHGGPYPASTDSRFTAVGINSIKRWVRPFSYQNWPNELLPNELKNQNPLNINRLVNNTLTNNPVY